MGKRHKMINVPAKNPIQAGDFVKVKKITSLVFAKNKNKEKNRV